MRFKEFSESKYYLITFFSADYISISPEFSLNKRDKSFILQRF